MQKLVKCIVFPIIPIIFVFFTLACSPDSLKVEPTEGLTGFEASIDEIRVDLRIPGMAVCLVEDEIVVWSKGLGYADLINRVPVTENTSFHVASLTKTFAAIIAMRLVESGDLDLQSPVSEYGVDWQSVRGIHLLTHTAQSEPPGTEYQYCGDCFALMDKVIESVSGETFEELLVENIIKPLDLKHTAPSLANDDAFRLTGYDKKIFENNMAVPYENSGIGGVRQTEYRTYFGTAAGMVSSVSDLGKYAVALERQEFLLPETWETVFTPAASVSTGETLPYGIGWFIQENEGHLLHWHYGQWQGCSSLIIRVPDMGITFIALANNETLSSSYPMGKGDVTKSKLARLFLDYYVTGDEHLP
jgi:CubicO group peptidase (beta-lactamase class C family)